MPEHVTSPNFSSNFKNVNHFILTPRDYFNIKTDIWNKGDLSFSSEHIRRLVIGCLLLFRNEPVVGWCLIRLFKELTFCVDG